MVLHFEQVQNMFRGAAGHHQLRFTFLTTGHVAKELIQRTQLGSQYAATDAFRGGWCTYNNACFKDGMSYC